MYHVVDIIANFVFEGILYILPISKETRWKLVKYSTLLGFIGIVVILFALLALIGWVNLK